MSKLSTIAISRKKCSIVIPRVRNMTIHAIDPMGHVSGLKWTGNWSERAGRGVVIGTLEINYIKGSTCRHPSTNVSCVNAIHYIYHAFKG